MVSALKRLVVGRPLRSDRLGETLLSKRLALPVFASDPLSSVAYATQEILLVLTLGGLAYLYLAPWVALAVVISFSNTVLELVSPRGTDDFTMATANALLCLGFGVLVY